MPLIRKLISTATSLFICLLPLTTQAAPPAEHAPPAWATINRPANAPPISVPAFDRIHSTVIAEGSARVIVRFKEPAESPQAFQVEGKLADESDKIAQRAAIKQVQDTILKRISAKNAKHAKKFNHIPHMAVEVDQADLEQLLASGEIDLIEEDVPVPPDLSQSVPLIGADGSGTFSGYTGNGQTVAILDTGVDKTHEFLTGKVVSEACYSTTYAGHAATTVCPNGQSSMTTAGAGVNCNTAISGCTHGTHVAGIAAGKGVSFNGVAKDATIIAVQVFSRFDANCGGSPTPCALSYTSDQIAGLDRVYALRSTYNIAAVNMSLGGGSNASYCDAANAAQKASIDNLRSAGIATIIATGNNGYTSSISAPGCISTAVSVGATTKSDTVASYSNSASILSLLAPGSSIYSSTPGNNYASWNGTSMATPHVAGAWAVMKSKKPAATVDEVLNALQSTGVSVTDSRNGITKPRIKVDSALSLMNGASVTLTPSAAGPQYIGASVTFTAAGSGGGGSYDYEFYLLAPGGNWVKKQAYGNGASWNWSTTGLSAGTYQVKVWMKDAGTSPAVGYDTFQSINFVLSAPPAATGITVTTDKASPQPTGTTITFTAAGSGGTGSYEYRYYLLPPGGSWAQKQAYSSTPTWTFDTTGLAAGTYIVETAVRTAGSSSNVDYYKNTTIVVTTNSTTGLTVSTNKTSPQVAGTSVTFTASGSGGSGSYEYRYYLLPPGGTWTLKQAYSSTANWTFDTTGLAAGTYTVETAVRTAGSSSDVDVYKNTSFVVSTNVTTGLTVSTDKTSPQAAGTSVTFTASGSGGSGSYEYRYYLLPPGGTWTLKQAYSSTPTWTFDTTGLAAGTYTVETAVRTAGSGSSVDVYKNTTFVVTTNPTTGLTVSTDKATPQVAGTAVTFTASGSGGTGSYEYRYYLLPPGGTWALKQAYSSTATWTFDTTGLAAGTYTVETAVRTAGSGSSVDVYKNTTFVITSNPTTGLTVSTNKTSPQVAGSLVTFTAAGSGGTGSYEYKFWLRNLNGSWSTMQNYSSTATWTWNTAGYPPGTYIIEVDAKSAGSSPSGGSDIYKTLTFSTY